MQWDCVGHDGSLQFAAHAIHGPVVVVVAMDIEWECPPKATIEVMRVRCVEHDVNPLREVDEGDDERDSCDGPIDCEDGFHDLTPSVV